MLRVRGAGTVGLTFLWSLDSNLHAKCKVSKPSSLQKGSRLTACSPFSCPVLVDQALKARPSFQLEVKLVTTLTWG